MKLLEMLSADVGVQHVSKLVESVDKNRVELVVG